MATFDPTNVLPDSALFGFQPINVQTFLEQHGSYLATKILGTDEGPVAVSSWITRHAQQNNVNPAWILVRLQAEQGLISVGPTQAAVLGQTAKTWNEVDDKNQKKIVTGTQLGYKERWALGYSAFEGGFKPMLGGRMMAGMENQIKEMAAWTARQGLNTAKGIPAETVDGQPLQAKTRATYAIYRYTPHVGAARETQAVYAKFFPQFLPA